MSKDTKPNKNMEANVEGDVKFPRAYTEFDIYPYRVTEDIMLNAKARMNNRQLREREGREVQVKKEREEREVQVKKEREEVVKKKKGWINWRRWGISARLVLFNIIFAIPIAYAIARYAVPDPFRWMGFILCHHVMLACGYEGVMNFRDRLIKEAEESFIKEAGEKMELEKWDEVVEKLEVALAQSRNNLKVMEMMEDQRLGMARQAVTKKLKGMKRAEREGKRIDEGLLRALMRERLELGYVAHGWMHGWRHGDENHEIDRKWKGKSWEVLCEARGILED
ncbi:hypothetical protein NHQ30_001691 [Ciborinia camelliae]|nr:hypothetical protein NHQ30_001691 [Ciborinia camelliae]